MKKINKLIFILSFLLFCSIAIALPPKITEPHTRFNPWMDECVYFFTFGQCYVDPDYCSKEYGKSAMEDTMITLNREEECIYSREEYREYLRVKKLNESKEEKIQENTGPFIFVIDETQYITLLPKGYDPDEDSVVYKFTKPLNDKGGWQTDYGDAGEYNVTITASDGNLHTSKNALIVVKKKEEVPEIKSFGPAEKIITIDEGSKIGFSVAASDKNKDELAYLWELDGKEASSEKSYNYKAGYDAAGKHVVKAIVTDGVNVVDVVWNVNVKNVNRAPVLDNIPDAGINETETAALKLKAADLDDDELKFSIDNNKFIRVGDRFEWKTTYDDAGEYTVKVTVSDGIDSAEQKVKINVENVNRPPVIISVTNVKR